MNPTRRKFIKLGGAACLGLPALANLPVQGASWNSKPVPNDPRAKLPTLNQNIRAAADTPRLSMLFQGKSRDELIAWQEKFSAKMRELMGPIDPPTKWTVRTIETKSFDDHVREEMLLMADGVPSLPLYVLRPLSPRSSKLPIVLCLHGHGTSGHDPVVGRDETPELRAEIKKYNYDYARQLVRHGYMTVAPCFLPFGRRLDKSQRDAGGDPCTMTFVRLMNLGRTLVAENLRDARWALDYAASRSDARADRIGCVGLSYGGRMTMFTAAFDARVKVAVISGSLNMFQERVTKDAYCGAQVVPHILEYGDTPEIASLIAPRPTLWEMGSEDLLIVPGWREIAQTRIQRAYAAAGKPEAVSYHSFKGGHRWEGSATVPLLARVLK